MDNEESTVVNDAVVADAPVADSAPAEKTKSEVARVELNESGEYSRADIPEENEPAEAEPVEEPQTEAEPQGEKPLSPKSENRFQQLANENRQYKEEIARLKAQEAQFAQEQELLNEVNPETGDYYTPQEVERIAFQKSRENQAQQLAEQRYALEIQQNQQTIASEAQRAMQEFPEFDETSPQYDPELTAQADAIMQQSIITDDRGAVIGANVSPYLLYKTIAEPARRAAAKAKVLGQTEAQKATAQMLANADGTGSAQQGDKPFEKLSLTEMQAKLRKQGHDI